MMLNPKVLRLPSSMDYIINEHLNPQLIDVGVTVLSLIGAQFPYTVDGLKLVSLNKKKPQKQIREKIYSEEYMKGFPKVGMIENDMKYIYNIRQKKIVEVYNLAEDDKETNNLLNTYGHDLNSQEANIKDWLGRKAEWRCGMINQKVRALINPSVREQLKSLGYLQNGGKDQP